MKPTIAAFDLDGTLTDRDCVVPFVSRVAGRHRVMAALAAKALRDPTSVRHRDEMKSAISHVFAGRSVDELDRAAIQFVDDHVVHWLRSDTLSRLEEHRALGHQIVIVSASFDIYVSRIAERLGVDALATRLEVVNGRVTGRLDGLNCRGSEKVRRLDEWAATRFGRGIHGVDLYAYGDSDGDRQMLATADHAVRVTPPRRWRLV